jgi:hypothetical protein
MGHLTIDLNGTDKHKAPHTGMRGLSGQVQRALHIRLPVSTQGVAKLVSHHMNPCSAMDHGLHALQSCMPVGCGQQISHENWLHTFGQRNT